MRISDWSSDVCSSDLILIVDEQDISGDSNDRDKDDGENYTPAASPAFNDGGGGSLYHPFGYPFVSHVTLLTLDSFIRRGIRLACHKHLASGKEKRGRTGCPRSAEHTHELQSLMRTSHAVF